MAKKTKVRRVRTANDKATLLTALTYIVLGLLFVFCGIYPDILKWIMLGVGILIAAFGVYELVKRDYVTGLVMIVVGILFALGVVDAIITIMLIVIGVVLAVLGAYELIIAFKSSRVAISDIISAILSIVAGIFLIVAGSSIITWAFIVVGVIMFVDGILIFFGKKLI